MQKAPTEITVRLQKCWQCNAVALWPNFPGFQQRVRFVQDADNICVLICLAEPDGSFVHYNDAGSSIKKESRNSRKRREADGIGFDS